MLKIIYKRMLNGCYGSESWRKVFREQGCSAEYYILREGEWLLVIGSHGGRS